jgi:hypothetical protein
MWRFLTSELYWYVLVNVIVIFLSFKIEFISMYTLVCFSAYLRSWHAVKIVWPKADGNSKYMLNLATFYSETMGYKNLNLDKYKFYACLFSPLNHESFKNYFSGCIEKFCLKY